MLALIRTRKISMMRKLNTVDRGERVSVWIPKKVTDGFGDEIHALLSLSSYVTLDQHGSGKTI